MLRSLRSLPLYLFVLPAAAHAQQPTAPARPSTSYVVLVSLNGFRSDYAKEYHATHLLALAARGASAPDGMMPAYPAQTAPNLYTLVTGLYPQRHGIVADAFFDPARKETYRGAGSQSAADASWYGGVPLWSLAEQQGIRTACIAWLGCEAKIAGERPAYSAPAATSDARRIQQVVAWLRLPGAKRPHFIAASLGDVERTAHDSGPDSRETAAAVRREDALLGQLQRDLAALHLPIDLIVVSDHGFAQVDGGWIDLDAYAPLTGLTNLGDLLYAPTETAANAAYQKLKAADARFMVYRRAKAPPNLHIDANPRIGDPVIIARGHFAIRALSAGSARPAPGVDGLDPFLIPEMKGIFFAEGPDIRPGVTLRPFENVNVYPMIAELLGLKAPPTDGNANILSGILSPATSR